MLKNSESNFSLSKPLVVVYNQRKVVKSVKKMSRITNEQLLPHGDKIKYRLKVMLSQNKGPLHLY